MNQESSLFMTNSSKLASVRTTGSPALPLFPDPPEDDEDFLPEALPESLTSAVFLTYSKAKSIMA